MWLPGRGYLRLAAHDLSSSAATARRSLWNGPRTPVPGCAGPPSRAACSAIAAAQVVLPSRPAHVPRRWDPLPPDQARVSRLPAARSAGPGEAGSPSASRKAPMSVSPSPRHRSVIVARLRSAGCVFAQDGARLLISAARTRDDLAAMVDRRAAGLPLEHVLGWAEFWGLRIAMDPGVFVPRRRTEFLVSQAVSLTSQAPARA